MAKAMQILLLVGSIGAFIFIAAACGGNVWKKYDYLGADASMGLWKACGDTQFGRTICTDLKDIPGWLKTCRAFSALSVIATIVAIIFAILSLAVERIRGFIASIFLFGAAGCMVIALIVYTDKYKKSIYDLAFSRFNQSYGWSYFLGWIGSIGAIAAGIMGFFAEKC